MEKTSTSTILGNARAFVKEAYKTRMPGKYLFHNFNHIEEVLKHGLKIGQGSNLSEHEMELLQLAIYFHDLGYDKGSEGHENRSVEYVKEFLSKANYDSASIDKVASAINCTNPNVEPTTLLEKCMLDADSAHVGTKNFPEQADLLRGEWEVTGLRKFTDKEWATEQVEFLQKHKFYTEFAENNYGTRKGKNLVFYQALLRKSSEKAEQQELKLAELKAKLAKIKAKDTKPERGVESMFRIMNRNHMELSAMADNKANILISVNAIIISITVSGLASKLDTNTYLVIPTIIFITACLGTIIFAILATRPKISGGRFTEEDIKQRRVNLMFFGNFFKMSLDEFQDGMTEMLDDKEFLYGNMIKDIYFLGLVLGKKYRLVRIAYNVFMYGIVIAVIAFVVSFFAFAPDPSELPGIPD